MIRNAFVLGAGLGTRLRSLTQRRPKPLIPICQKPLITFAFDHLIQNGIERFVVNTHHRAQVYTTIFPDGTYRGVPITFRHEEDLLETGGGIKNVERQMGSEPFIVYNGDILTDLPIERAVERHRAAGNEVTMILRSKDGPLQVSLDEASGRVVDIAQRIGAGVPSKYLFTGVYIVEPSFFLKIPPKTKISVIPIFLVMIQQAAKLGGIVLDEGHWWDLGTRTQYLDVHRFFSNPDFAIGIQREEGWPEWRHPEARVAADAEITGATVLGAGAEIGAGARLHDCVVWAGGKVEADSFLKNCIVTGRGRASGTHANLDF